MNSLRSNEKYKNAVIDNLNTLYKDAFGKTANKENLSALNYFFKTFNPNTSKYDLHTESPELFGDEWESSELEGENNKGKVA